MAALVAALVAIVVATSTSAPAGTVETRVGASSVVVEPLIGPPEHISAGQQLGNNDPRVVHAVATGVAAKAVPEGDHIGLALTENVQEFSASVGARHVLGQAAGEWQQSIRVAAADGSTRFSVSLAGVEGLAGSITRGAYRDAGVPRTQVGGRSPSWFDWEMYIRIERVMTVTPTIEDRPLPVTFDRSFFMHRFVSTHQSLLLRSPKGDGNLKRTDVLFKGVVALKVVSKLPTLGVRLASPEEAAAVKAECGEDMLAAGGLQIYMLDGAKTPGYVVALSMFACSDQRHGSNPSPLLFDVDGEPVPIEVFLRFG